MKQFFAFAMIILNHFGIKQLFAFATTPICIVTKKWMNKHPHTFFHLIEWMNVLCHLWKLWQEKILMTKHLATTFDINDKHCHCQQTLPLALISTYKMLHPFSPSSSNHSILKELVVLPLWKQWKRVLGCKIFTPPENELYIEETTNIFSTHWQYCYQNNVNHTIVTCRKTKKLCICIVLLDFHQGTWQT